MEPDTPTCFACTALGGTTEATERDVFFAVEQRDGTIERRIIQGCFAHVGAVRLMMTLFQAAPEAPPEVPEELKNLTVGELLRQGAPMPQKQPCAVSLPPPDEQLTFDTDEPTDRVPPQREPGEKIAPEKKKAAATERMRVLCLECKPHTNLLYNARASHAGQVHKVSPQLIRWEGVTKPLTYPCELHSDCLETGYSFPNHAGREAHYRGKHMNFQGTGAKPSAKKKSTTRRAPGAWVKGKHMVICPEEHKTPHASTPYYVVATDRGSHADMVHHKRIWEIDWIDDPTGAMAFSCTAHDGCPGGLKWPSEKSLAVHIKGMQAHAKST